MGPNSQITPPAGFQLDQAQPPAGFQLDQKGPPAPPQGFQMDEPPGALGRFGQKVGELPGAAWKGAQGIAQQLTQQEQNRPEQSTQFKLGGQERPMTTDPMVKGAAQAAVGIGGEIAGAVLGLAGGLWDAASGASDIAIPRNSEQNAMQTMAGAQKATQYEPSSLEGKTLKEAMDQIYGKSIGAIGDLIEDVTKPFVGEFVSKGLSAVAQGKALEKLGPSEPKPVKGNIDVEKIQPGVQDTNPTQAWKQEQLELFPKQPESFVGHPGDPQLKLFPELQEPGGGTNFFRPLTETERNTATTLQHPEVKAAIDNFVAKHEDLTNQIDAAADKYMKYEGAGVLEGTEGFKQKYQTEIDVLHAKRDALEEQVAGTFVKWGVQNMDEISGMGAKLPEAVQQALRVKLEQQQARQFAGILAKETNEQGKPLRVVEAGPMSVSSRDREQGLFPDQPVPVMGLGKAFTIPGITPKRMQLLDIQGMLAHIVENTQDPLLMEIAKKLHDYNLGSKGVSMSVHVDEKGNVVHNTDFKIAQRGRFILGSKAVQLGPEGLTERIVAHELAHGITAHAFLSALKSSFKMDNWAIDPKHPLATHAQAIVDIWKQLSAIRDKYTMAMRAYSSGREIRPEVGGVLYGLTNPIEMMAEIGTNIDFAKWANQQIVFVQGKPATLLGRIKDAMTGLFGKGMSSNAFDQIMFHTGKIADAYAHDPEKFDEMFHKLWSDNGFKEVQNPSSPLAKITGLEHTEMIYTPEPFAKAKEQIMKEKDSSSGMAEGRFATSRKMLGQSLGKNLMPGSIMAAALRDSTLIRNVGYLMNKGEKLAAQFKEKYIDPVKTNIGQLSESERVDLQKVFVKELANKARYTPEQMKQLGMSDKQIRAYNSLREVFDRSIDRTNDVRLTKGLDPITPLDAYYSSRWQGNYRSTFIDDKGKPIWAIAEKTAYDRQKAIDWIKKNFPNLKETNHTEHLEGNQINPLAAGYKEMLKFLDKNDPKTSVLHQLYEQIMGVKTENVTGFEKHFDIKSGVRGYLGDRPWTQKNGTDFFKAQLDYLNSAAKWNEFQGAFEEAHKYTTDPAIRDAQPNNVAYAEDYIRHKLGYADNKHIKALENLVASKLGLSPQHLLNVITIGKRIFYPLELSVKLPFVLISLLQHGFSISQHAMLDSMGYKAATPKYLWRGFAKGTQHAMLDGLEYFGVPNERMHLEHMTSMDGYHAFAREYAHANKLLEQTPLLEAKEITQTNFENTIEKVGNFTTAVSEKLARGWTFYGMVEHLADSGKFDLEDHGALLKMCRLAEDATKITMADYAATERSMIYSKLGLIGRAAGALKTYPTNMMSQLLLYGKEAGKGNVTPLAAFLAMQFAVGGMRGMFAADDLDAVWNAIKRHMPLGMYNDMYHTLPGFKDFGIRKIMTEHLPDFYYHGLVSKMTGTNIDVQGSMGRTIPGIRSLADGNVLEALAEFFPSISENVKLPVEAAEAILGGLLAKMPPQVPRPTPNEALESLYGAAPAGARGLIREEVPGFKRNLPPGGKYSAEMFNPSKLEEGEYNRTSEEESLGKTGFISPREQRFKDAAHAARENKAVMAEHRKEVIKDLEEFALRHNAQQVQYYAKMYYELGGQLNELQNEVHGAAKEKFLDMARQAALDLRTSENPEKIKQARDFLNALTNQHQ